MDTEPRHHRAAEWVAEHLTRQILSGQYPPGAMLPGERVLATQMNVARSAVRAALAALEARGLLRRRAGRGTEVALGTRDSGKPTIAAVHVYAGTLCVPEYAALRMGIAARLRERGYGADEIFVWAPATSQDPPGSFGGTLTVPGQLAPHLNGYDAVLFHELVTPDSEALALAMEREHRPVVVANLEQACPVSCTRVEHRQVFREATEILLNFGHRRIAFVGRDRRFFFYQAAIDGYGDALNARGIAVDEDLTAYAPLADALGGYVATRELLTRRDPPTAIVAGRDVLAQGVCHAIEEAGLRVGFDVSVISYDNLSYPCAEPFLTTFNEPAYDMGTVAVDMLLERLIGGWRPVEQRTLEAKLVLRRSASLCRVAAAAAGVADSGVSADQEAPSRISVESEGEKGTSP